MNREDVIRAITKYREDGLDANTFSISGLDFQVQPYAQGVKEAGWMVWECTSLQHLVTFSGYPVYNAHPGGVERLLLSAGYFAYQIQVMRHDFAHIGGDVILGVDPYSQGANSRVLALAWELFNANGGRGLVDHVEVSYRNFTKVSPRIASVTFLKQRSRIMVARWDGTRAFVSSSPAVPIQLDMAMESFVRIANTNIEESFAAGEIDPIMDREETDAESQ